MTQDIRPGDADSYDVSLDRVLTALLRHPFLVFGIPLSLAALGLTYVLLFGSYLSQSTFTPEESGVGLGSLSGLAAQLGVSVPGGLDGESRSLDFYVKVLRSPAVLDQVAATRYTFPKRPDGTDSVSGTLYELYDIDEGTDAERTWSMIKMLQPRISVDADRIAKVITIQTKAPWPSLSQQMNRRMLDVLEDINTGQRQRRAAMQREFFEGRLAQALADLSASEVAYQQFLEQNRMYETSPELSFEAGRLQRRVDLRQQLYVTLSQAYEQAAIEALRDTPMITVLDAPELFFRRSRNPWVVAATAIITGLVIGLTLALAVEFVTSAAASGARWARQFSRILRLEV